MTDIRTQQLIYHLTDLENLESILDNGLLPRNQLHEFQDIADPEIIAHRRRHHLDSHVPFHWFARNPFDGRVQTDHPDKEFVLITVNRLFAAQQNWKVVPRHPLATEEPELHDYADGFNAIDWEVMNRREYHDPECKSICMAECLSPAIVQPNDFAIVFVRSDEIKANVWNMARRKGLNINVIANRNMFTR